MTTYPTRSLGRNGPQVPAIGFGAMSIGGAYGTPLAEVEEKLQVLDHAHAIGSRFWDTADVYGDCEDRIGDWFKHSGKRDDIFLATKFGLKYDANFQQSEHSDYDYVKSACEKSLSRLGVDVIDLYYCHCIDGKTPIEEIVRAMAELKNEGKICFLGLSEVSAATIRRAHAVHPISAYQIEYSPFSLDIESEKLGILKTCRELGITIVAYSLIGRGLLTGQIKSYDDLDPTDHRRMFPRFSEANFPKIMALVDRFRAIADQHDCSVSQVCLSWILAQGDDIIPIPGTQKTKYLDLNHGAANIQLTADKLMELRHAAE
ncbi:Aldo/keto reductase [Ilyonectria robusta]